MIRELLNRFLGESREISDSNSRVAKYWENFHSEIAEKQLKWTDWGDHPKVIELVQQAVFGGKNTSLLAFLKHEYPDISDSNVLSLCCGTGSFEKSLVEAGVFSHVTGIDISQALIDQANAILGAYDQQLNFIVGDVNQGNFGEDRYDIVFAKAALHHVERLEDLMLGIRNCLKPGGRLIALDFFGPTRFQWTDQQIEAANRIIESSMPESVRLREDGSSFTVTRPTIEHMIELDPSEAVRSGDIKNIIEHYFTNVRWLDVGGTILNLVLDGSIINSFDENNPEHNNFIEKVFQYERESLGTGVLDSDFRLVIATP